MTSAVAFYEQLSSAPDDKTRARLIAEAFERMEERYPEVRDLATQAALTETALQLKKEIIEAEGRLQIEIEQLRGEIGRDIEQLRGELNRDIEQLRGAIGRDIEQLRGEFNREIEQLRVEQRDSEGRLSKEIEQMRSSGLRWVVGLLSGQTLVIITALFAIAGGQ